LVASAFGTSISQGEGVADLVSVPIVKARARFVRARDLAVGLTGAGVAVLGNRLPDGQGHGTVLAVAWHRVVGARKLSTLETCACITFISVKGSTQINHFAHVWTPTSVVCAFNLATGLACARVASVLGECLTELVGHAVGDAVTWVVTALHLPIGQAGADIAVLLSGFPDLEGLPLVGAAAWDGIVLAGDLSILLASALVAPIPLGEDRPDLDDSVHVVARADLVVANNLGIGGALAGLTAIKMTNALSTNLVLGPVVVTFAFLVSTCDHSHLGASACVASISVDP